MKHLPDSALMGLRPIDMTPKPLAKRYPEPPRPEEGDLVRSPALRYALWVWIAALFAGVFTWNGKSK